jgi:hypothetical protein
MEKIIIQLKDQSKRHFLIQLLAQFEFIELITQTENKQEEAYDFFQSAGLFINREINADQLRKEAWRINR